MNHRIGIFHYKIEGTDGVSLELNKWKEVLERAGHKAFLLGGEVGDDNPLVYPELHHQTDIARRLYRYTFVSQDDFPSEKHYRTALYREAEKAEKRLEEWIVTHDIDFMIPQNIWSVAMNPAVAIAMDRVLRKHHIPALAQHHDFYWERIGGFKPTCDTARAVIDAYLPPKHTLYSHVVINTQSHDQLLQRKGIESVIIPNVFDFSGDPWVKDSYNSDLRSAIGLNDHDVLILQATRIVERKGIEAAVELTAEMEKMRDRLEGKRLWNGRTFTSDSSIVLVLAGYASDDASGTYVKRLKDLARKKNVKILCIGDQVGHERSTANGVKCYSLWDTYVHADIITYPSYWEGWGNQFLEGLFAKVPMVVYEYPVFLTDIAPRGFSYISLGNTYHRNPDTNLIEIAPEIITHAAQQCIELLLNAEKRTETVEHNFALGKTYYSMEALSEYLLLLI